MDTVVAVDGEPAVAGPRRSGSARRPGPWASLPPWLRVTLVGTLVVFLLNFLLLGAFGPRLGPVVGETEVDGHPAVLVEGLGAGGIGGGVSGYVNLVDPQGPIYLNAEHLRRAGNGATTYLEHHELFHVLERERVAALSGGYPSRWNPVATAIFLTNLARLNEAFAQVMPASGKDLPFSGGLEVAADCFGQPRGTALRPVAHANTYVADGGLCSPEQVAIVTLFATEGRWPDPLTPEEMDQVPELHVYPPGEVPWGPLGPRVVKLVGRGSH